MTASEKQQTSTEECQQGSSYYWWNPAVLAEFDSLIFSPAARSDDASINRLGRGAAFMFQYRGLNLVLRHYQRGGLVRHFNRDLYPFAGLTNTRMWREFHLLLRLQELALPVPVPVAAHCRRVFPGFYRGDLLTRTIPNCRTLAEVLEQRRLDAGSWTELGQLLARFHAAGVYHADLNANNILIDAAGQFFLIDFDKGELRQPGESWQVANLARLLRSLTKLQDRRPSFYFVPADWAALAAGYGSHSRDD